MANIKINKLLIFLINLMRQSKNKFLLLKGTYEYSSKKKKFVFPLLDGDSITSKKLRHIVDPTYDSTFKLLFGMRGAEERLKALLNAFLYPGIIQKEIQSLTYIQNAMHRLNEKNNNNSLITDIACQIMVDDQKYVVAIEMQLSDRGTLSKRLFNYGTTLSYNNSFTNCLALGISVSSKVESNYTKLQKKTYSHIEDLEYLKTILINVDIELKRMEAGENIQINQQNLEEDGKEFIKLLGIRNWGTKCDDNRFALPEWDISENSVINECINILSEISDTKLSRMILDEQYFEDIKTENYNAGMDEGMKKGMNKGLIIAAFLIFLEEKEDERAFQILKSNNVQVKGDEEIKKILQGKKNSDVNDFIEYLNNYNFFLNSS